MKNLPTTLEDVLALGHQMIQEGKSPVTGDPISDADEANRAIIALYKEPSEAFDEVEQAAAWRSLEIEICDLPDRAGKAYFQGLKSGKYSGGTYNLTEWLAPQLQDEAVSKIA